MAGCLTALVRGMVTRGADSTHAGKNGDEENFRHSVSGLAYLHTSKRPYRVNWSARNDETLIRQRTAHRFSHIGAAGIPGLFSRINQEFKMNKDQVKGATKEAAGKVQEAAGKLVGSKEQQAKGLGKQAAGGAQKAYGDAKENLKDASK